MAGAAPLQANFNSGELDPRMVGRVDFERLRTALVVCKNQIPRVTGSVTRRPGTYFCDEVRDSSKYTRCVKFKYSTIQAYVLEFSDQAIRFKKNEGPIHNLTLNITNITKANPAVVTYTGTDPANGDDVDIDGVVGMTEVNKRRFRVTNVNAGGNTFQLYNLDGTAVNSTNYTTYGSNGTAQRVYQIASPYAEADLSSLFFTQNADTLYIWHPDYPERTLLRYADDNWSLVATTLVDGPYLPENTTTTYLQPSSSAPGTGVTLTASATTGINNNQGFLSSDVGRLIRIKQGSVWGYCQITGWTSTTVVTVTIINDLVNTNHKTAWRMGLYSDTTGYPSCGTFYGDRLYRGGCPEQIDRFDGSKVGDYLNMSPTNVDTTIVDDNAVSRRLNEDDVQAIRWMRGTGNGLIIGTLEGEWVISPSTNTEAITPSNIDAKMSTPFGSALVQPIKAGTAIVYVEAGGRRIREAQYQYYDNLLQAADMTIIAEHITKGDYDPAYPDEGTSTVARSGVTELAFQRKPIPVIWGRRKDGVLLGNTYSKDEKVLGWHRHILGGWANSLHTEHAEIESLCVVPSSDESYDQLWMVVKRYINGRVVRYNEFLTVPWEQGDDRAEAFFVDCGLTYDGAATTTIGGLFHLVGETVQLLVDGATHPDVVVSATGTITLTTAASVVQVGYAYNSDGQCFRFDVGAQDGTSQGKIQRVHKVVFRLYESLGLEVGNTFENLYALPFRSAADNMGSPPPLFTGDKDDFTWDGDYSTENYVCWRFATTQPGEVLAIMPRLHTQDGR